MGITPVGLADPPQMGSVHFSAQYQIVHWFTAESDSAFIFNIHVNDTDPGNPRRPGRVYVDPLGEKIAGGLIKAQKISYGMANQIYG